MTAMPYRQEARRWHKVTISFRARGTDDGEHFWRELRIGDRVLADPDYYRENPLPGGEIRFDWESLSLYAPLPLFQVSTRPE